jgi:phosphoribosylformimino-5-aminoimidazole carboxamide ribotide isomerase
VSGLTRLGVSLWLDAGVTSARAAARAISLGVAVVVVGLETLPSFEVLGEICDTIGGERVAFSLDLRGGQPVSDDIVAGAGDSALRLAERAASAGAAAIIVLDLARVGTGQGLDLVLIGAVRKAAPYVTLLAGGGVRGQEDLTLLEEIGCDGALVGTALISGDLKISHRRS